MAQWIAFLLLSIGVSAITSCIDLRAGQEQWARIQANAPPATSTYSLSSCSSSCTKEKCHATCFTF